MCVCVCGGGGGGGGGGKGGSRHFGLGGGGCTVADPKIRTPLGGSGGMTPQKIFDIFML